MKIIIEQQPLVKTKIITVTINLKFMLTWHSII